MLGRVTPKMTRVLFCGNEFTWSYHFTKEALAKHADIEVCLRIDVSIVLQLIQPAVLLQVLRCERSEVPDRIEDMQVAIPFMARIDDATMKRAPALKLILQYGVGVEGIDMAAVS